VSTQVIEAGVDVDFPLVMRALGPLDRIAQAAGRCNREGKLPSGQVIVFKPEDGRMPPGAYRIGAQISQDALHRLGTLDMDDPAVYSNYFQALYQKVSRDTHNIQALRASLDYPEVSRKGRMIEDEDISVVVLYDAKARQLLGQLERAEGTTTRQVLRQLHPYIVNLREKDLQNAIKGGQASELLPGLWRWEGMYSQTRGIVLESAILL